jgi:hypothetical protein
MIAWNITPASDPERAEIARRLALRPITLAGTIR